MPVYEYECKACGHEFEREQRISDDPVKKCPSCSAMKAKRLISRTSFVLKGSGWYNDLYSSAKPGKDEGKVEGDAKGADKGEGKSEGKGDKSKGKSGGKSDGKSGSKSDGGSSGGKAKGKAAA